MNSFHYQQQISKNAISILIAFVWGCYATRFSYYSSANYTGKRLLHPSRFIYSRYELRLGFVLVSLFVGLFYFFCAWANLLLRLYLITPVIFLTPVSRSSLANRRPVSAFASKFQRPIHLGAGLTRIGRCGRCRGPRVHGGLPLYSATPTFYWDTPMTFAHLGLSPIWDPCCSRIRVPRRLTVCAFRAHVH